MKLSIEQGDLVKYVVHQTNVLLPYDVISDHEVSSFIETAIKRLVYCLSKIKLKYYRSGFNHLNADHYAKFLYFLSNTAYKCGNIHCAEKFYLLNKFFHGIDLFYSIKMPDVFLLVHPLSSVIGNAQYGEFSVFYQNVTIGSLLGGGYPTFGKGTIFYSRSSVLGELTIGDNVVFGANSFLMHENVSSNSVVLAAYPNNRILHASTVPYQEVFEV